jgi:hypothetical protein
MRYTPDCRAAESFLHLSARDGVVSVAILRLCPYYVGRAIFGLTEVTAPGAARGEGHIMRGSASHDFRLNRRP